MDQLLVWYDEVKLVLHCQSLSKENNHAQNKEWQILINFSIN